MKNLSAYAACGLITFFSLTTLGQGVGINTSSPDASALLDISGTDKGLLIPRIALSAANSPSPVSTPAEGLLIYNTATTGTPPNDVVPGFYYWDSSAWQQLSTGGGSAGWSLSGNAGTTSGTDFIGTTDNQAFDIRTNNSVRTRITTKGQIEQLNTGRSVFVGEFAGAADDLSNNDNVFVGYQAGFSSATGGSNTAVGRSAYYTSTNGDHNSAFGNSALYSNTDGASNTAVGYETLFANTKGYNNTAMGWGALRNNTTSVNNIAIGFRALYTQSFSNSNNTWNAFNVALGGYALYSTQATSTGTGIGNTAVGHNAGYNNTNGTYNTSFGYNSGPTSGGLTHTASIGVDAASNANYKMVMGTSNNNNNTGGYGNWQNFSDGRFKKDVQEDVPGLEFIKKLRPVTYHLDAAYVDEFMDIKQRKDRTAGEAEKKAYYERLDEVSSQRLTGFIAQEVETAAQELGYEFDGVHHPQDEKDNYTIGYATFVVPLVKATQEQQQLIEEQQSTIEKMQTEMNAMRQQLNDLEQKFAK